MLEASGAAASMFARVWTLVTLEAMSGQVHVQKIWQHAELPFKLPHVNVLVIQVVYKPPCTGFELRITKDGTQQSQLMLLYCWKQDRYTSRCWRIQVKSPEARHSWIHPLYQGFRTCLKTFRDTPIESETEQKLARNQHKLAGKHRIWHTSYKHGVEMKAEKKRQIDEGGRL